ncbi:MULTISPECIES: protein translocase subunit SecD [Corynebacterium]|uniref:protein translocase subunit SecD n=1 Tax=Corynebacterium TaxID=1716 RepID=UPI0009F32F4B|nr:MULTISPECIES: protein translocase subunit SecD [unclassified Corynebacterium]MCQ4609095.1 protein translocase subunit SecD [Corynebacterium sp. CCUG 61414]MCQ4615369.1 protein translocase subunit SecD [Corynebacterium pseudogenitalium]MDK8243827.1 protein translocase subunit SecD [Corynebacterium sp. UMB10321]MDK8363140.1 protein translocase subunit SecD [Corynebacterium sp. UMB10119B]WPJ93039.1 protein translocase subunit SecD [Corynebacterium sp. UMB2355A]
MSKNTQRSGELRSKRKWPARALALFALIVIGVYSLVFFTGDKSATPKLGIDLQGGTRVTLVPQGDEPTREQLDEARNILEKRVNGMGVSGATVVVDGNTLVITAAGDDTSEVRNIGQTSQLLFRPVMQPPAPSADSIGEVFAKTANDWIRYGVLTADQAKAIGDQVKKQVAEQGQTVEIPAIDAKPLPEPNGPVESSERRADQAEMLKATRQSEDPTQQFVAMSMLSALCAVQPTDPLAGTDDEAAPLVACDPSSGQVLLLGEVPLLAGVTDTDGPRLTGEQIDTGRSITGGFNPQSSQMEINFAFSQAGEFNGSSTWAQLTSEMIGQQIAITLDSQIISAPVIQGATPVGSATSITGNFTQEEAESLANNLRYGALPLSFAGENGEPGGTAMTVPPSLGLASLQAGFYAGIVGLILVAIFVFFYYRLYGLISLATLFFAGLLVYGSLVLLGRWIGYSLDLSGVAGLIIGIGTTADSFVVIYERIKDEVRKGKTFRSASASGWDRAKDTIITGNMVTLIGAVIIYFLAVGDVKGFAFTMGLTTVFDLLVTFLVTAPLMVFASRSRFWSKPAVNGMTKVFAAAQHDKDVSEEAHQGVAAEAASESIEVK